MTAIDVKRNGLVVVLGADLAKRLFGEKNPLNQQLRLNNNLSFLVIGIMKPKGYVLGINFDDAAFIPITTISNRIIGRTSPYGMEVSLTLFAGSPAP